MSNKIKHPHAEIIKKWLDDQTAAFEEYDSISSGRIGVNEVISDICGERQIRIKEFNLTNGYWYPCVDQDLDEIVYYFDGKGFMLSPDRCCDPIHPKQMSFIGESLGELKFK